jgi:histone-lysine N-methyltransferase SETD2
MSDSGEDMKDPGLAEDEPEMKPDDALAGAVTNGEGAHSRSRSPSHPQQDHTRTPKSRSTSHSPVKNVKKESGTSTPLGAGGLEATIGGEVSLKMEPGKMPKLSRTTSQKVTARPPPLFLDEADKTEEACQGFQVIRDCEYQNKSLGLTEDEGLDEVQCECDEEYGESSKYDPHIDRTLVN